MFSHRLCFNNYVCTNASFLLGCGAILDSDLCVYAYEIDAYKRADSSYSKINKNSAIYTNYLFINNIYIYIYIYIQIYIHITIHTYIYEQVCKSNTTLI